MYRSFLFLVRYIIVLLLSITGSCFLYYPGSFTLCHTIEPRQIVSLVIGISDL